MGSEHGAEGNDLEKPEEEEELCRKTGNKNVFTKGSQLHVSSFLITL